MSSSLPNQSTPDKPWLVPYGREATADDILACFRLILGRLPRPDEWIGHLGHCGRELDATVANYLNSAEFAQRGLLQQKPPGDIELVQLADYRIYAPTADEAVGRHVAHGVYDPHVTQVLRHFLRPGMGMLDLGANIGVFALLAAALVGPTGYVLAMEPNPANVRLLEASRLANGFDQLTVCQAAASATVGVLTLNCFDSNGTATVAAERALLTAQTVAALPVDLLIEAGRTIGLIKIDVEGGEHLALQGALATLVRCRPTIVSEFSPGQLAAVSRIDGPGYLHFLQQLGYRIGVLARDGSFDTGLPVADIVSAYEATGIDHIDIVAVHAEGPASG